MAVDDEQKSLGRRGKWVSNQLAKSCPHSAASKPISICEITPKIMLTRKDELKRQRSRMRTRRKQFFQKWLKVFFRYAFGELIECIMCLRLRVQISVTDQIMIVSG